MDTRRMLIVHWAAESTTSGGGDEHNEDNMNDSNTPQLYPIKLADNSYIDQFDTIHETKAQKDKRRIPAPSKFRKSLAEYYAAHILFRLGVPAEFKVVGSKYILCTTCQAINYYANDWCERCGTKLTQPQQWNSSIAYPDDHWFIVIARDVTQRKEPLKDVRHIVPSHGLEKESIYWTSFINLCWILAPIAYCRIREIRPWRFQVAAWKVHAHKTHVRWARLLAEANNDLLEPYKE